MYLEFFNLREMPFSLSSESRYFYASEKHTEALANMLYAIQQRKGLVMVSGEVGAGKTFLARMLCEQLGPTCQTLRVANPPGSGRQLLEVVVRKLGMNVRANSKYLLAEELEKELVHLLHRGRLVAMVLDEAQDLAEDSLEELRLLWNLEEDGQRLLQIVLIGQPELKQKLTQKRWEAMRQRIALTYHLGPLTREDTMRYVPHRIRAAADVGCTLTFEPTALALVYQATLGIPRMINVLCDNALLLAFSRSTHCVTEEIVAKAMKEMTCWEIMAPAAQTLLQVNFAPEPGPPQHAAASERAPSASAGAEKPAAAEAPPVSQVSPAAPAEVSATSPPQEGPAAPAPEPAAAPPAAPPPAGQSAAQAAEAARQLLLDTGLSEDEIQRRIQHWLYAQPE